MEYQIDVRDLETKELLSLMLGGKDSLKVAEDVLSYSAKNGESLLDINVHELSSIVGVSENKANSILAGFELARRLRISDDASMPTFIRDSEDIYRILHDELRYEKKEHLIAFLLNVKGGIISRETISIGDLSSSCVHPREVFSPAIRKGAAAIIVAHNHPSGDPSPSQDDILATERLVEASEIIGIKLVDHVIIGHGSYESLRAIGVIA